MKNMEIKVLSDKAILKMAQKQSGMTQMELSEIMGIRQSALSTNMSRPRMSLGVFVRILDILGYEVVVTEKDSGEAVWKVEVEK